MCTSLLQTFMNNFYPDFVKIRTTKGFHYITVALYNHNFPQKLGNKFPVFPHNSYEVKEQLHLVLHWNHIFQCSFGFYIKWTNHLNLRASLSDSKRVKISPSRTGPLTFRIIWRFCSPRNSTLTWVHCPWEPVRPKILMTRAKVTDLSMVDSAKINQFFLLIDAESKLDKSRNS